MQSETLAKCVQKFERIAQIIDRNLYHQREKVEDAKSIAMAMVDELTRSQAALSTGAEPFGWIVKKKGAAYKGTFFAQEPLSDPGRWDRENYDVFPVYETPFTSAEPVSGRNDEAGYVEFLNEDVPYIVRDIEGRCAILVDLHTRKYIGYRVYDPDSDFGSHAAHAEPVKTAPAVAVKALQDAAHDAAIALNAVLEKPEDKDRHHHARHYLEVLRSALSAQVQDVEGWQNEEKLTPEQGWTILCETPDITSPEEYPDHALITFEQLKSYMERANKLDEWQDISTARRDGTKILMRGGAYHGLPFAGYWDRSPYAPDRPWVSAVNNSRLYEHVPTHWMPLPASPASKHGDEE